MTFIGKIKPDGDIAPINVVTEYFNSQLPASATSNHLFYKTVVDRAVNSKSVHQNVTCKSIRSYYRQIFPM